MQVAEGEISSDRIPLRQILNLGSDVVLIEHG